ncbi:hypothetical protein PG991_001777 [Apiospora marii]|uniref:DUF7053 domain-containing protein n=1 Tax=Apiospora marii TaxID=335849 RepID=A0ABR1SPR6_9PEZI
MEQQEKKKPILHLLTLTTPPRRLHPHQQNPPPPGVTKPAAVAALQDHDKFLHADPHLTTYRRLTSPEEASSDYASYKVPKSIVPLHPASSGPQVKVYEVHDHVPNPVWSSDVTSLEEFVDCAEGVWVRVRSPLGIVLETTWFICEKQQQDKDKDGSDSTLELVQTLVCTCNRLLAPICKGQVDKGWRAVHEKLIQGMVGEDRTTAAATQAQEEAAAPTLTTAKA